MKQRACGKRRFRDAKQAKQALRRLADKPGRIPVRWYPCPTCHGVHLTSQS